jgi:hypothetical protein
MGTKECEKWDGISPQVTHSICSACYWKIVDELRLEGSDRKTLPWGSLDRPARSRSGAKRGVHRSHGIEHGAIE